MNIRILTGLAALVLGFAATAAQAGQWHGSHEHRGYVERAYVEGGYAPAPRLATVIGGAIGAAIGSDLAQGADRPGATVAGAIIGAIVGSQVSHEDRDDRRYRHWHR